MFEEDKEKNTVSTFLGCQVIENRFLPEDVIGLKSGNEFIFMNTKTGKSVQMTLKDIYAEIRVLPEIEPSTLVNDNSRD